MGIRQDEFLWRQRSITIAVDLNFAARELFDIGFLLRELDDALGLTNAVDDCLEESFASRVIRHHPVHLLQQSNYSLLAGRYDSKPQNL